MGLTHFDENGKAVMVDVTGKEETVREATAAGKIIVNREVFRAVSAGTVGKGDVLAVAATAGIAGAKRTSDLIPMCHILPITNCKVNFHMDEEECAIYCICTVKVTGKTGVEMEALTGVSVALLTIYDMCKALDKKMEISGISLLKKTGGKSGDIWNDFGQYAKLIGKELSAENGSAGKAKAEDAKKVCREKEKRACRWKAAVVTMSDKGFSGEREDKSGPLICDMIADQGYDVVRTELLPDEQKEIEKCLCTLCDEEKVDIIFTTGGTGFSPRDCTPEAAMAVAHRNVPGIAEAMRAASAKVTPRAMLSRAVCVIRKKTLIVNLPGSPKAVKENLEAVLPVLEHGLDILTDQAGECGR
ncbi:bifunctional molybdenum cofactor biosynthesis protein MoaC/MoaB [Mediterraneibacter sp.]|uniref:bifunctional molybdenum cofactor biosynthesis protein MoaC/MoaB n=1 Tax=Mediterraneibacter sp. TaxID=2316022 RepID=UPI0027BB1127|nr:bifunctional molybdenum cofactor biosynthesis protein MoaC/MoaB [Mediterraneibacter sp.]